MFKFIGTGSAFNPKLGNNGVYYLSQDDKSMVMIDCGELTFGRLGDVINHKGNPILSELTNMNVVITHLHPDHVGSLGTLAFYMFYVRGQKLNVYFPDGEKITQLAKLMGFDNCITVNTNVVIDNHLVVQLIEHVMIDDTFNINFDFSTDKGCEGIKFSAHHTPHAPELDCFSYRISFELNNSITGNGTDRTPIDVYYSGDTNHISKDMINVLVYAYNVVILDVSTGDYEGNVHIGLPRLIDALEDTTPRGWKRIIASHHDTLWDAAEVKTLYGIHSACTLQKYYDADIFEYLGLTNNDKKGQES